MYLQRHPEWWRQQLERASLARTTPPAPPLPARRASASGSPVLSAIVAVGGAYLVIRALSHRGTRRRGIPHWVRDEVSRRAGWDCEYCGVRVTRSTREIDHATSLANGGSHTLRNFRNACGGCNRAKGRRNRRDFVRALR